jgi:hypothetical protein
MKDAFGALHWTPETFWRSTITEYMMAIEGFNDANSGASKDGPPSDAELADLVARYG